MPKQDRQNKGNTRKQLNVFSGRWKNRIYDDGSSRKGTKTNLVRNLLPCQGKKVWNCRGKFSGGSHCQAALSDTFKNQQRNGTLACLPWKALEVEVAILLCMQ